MQSPEVVVLFRSQTAPRVEIDSIRLPVRFGHIWWFVTTWDHLEPRAEIRKQE